MQVTLSIHPSPVNFRPIFSITHMKRPKSTKYAAINPNQANRHMP